jgi:hypothetical protein
VLVLLRLSLFETVTALGLPSLAAYMVHCLLVAQTSLGKYAILLIQRTDLHTLADSLGLCSSSLTGLG